MNTAFREYAFGRSFNLNLTEKMIDALARLCKGDDPMAHLGLRGDMNGLHRRGLVELEVRDGVRTWRPNRAGLLVYQLLVEAGEYAALEREREELIEAQHQMWQREWEERFADVKVTVRDKFRRDLPAGAGTN